MVRVEDKNNGLVAYELYWLIQLKCLPSCPSQNKCVLGKCETGEDSDR